QSGAERGLHLPPGLALRTLGLRLAPRLLLHGRLLRLWLLWPAVLGLAPPSLVVRNARGRPHRRPLVHWTPGSPRGLALGYACALIERISQAGELVPKT